jgi:ABC-type transporter Mla maintaining outer membrane lipid asymmetry ATPase subunit MlaF
VSAPVLELSDVSKDYRGLRPLRIARLLVAATDQIAIVGLDRAAAEVFVNLVTGTTLPDLGEVRLFGRLTTAIADSADWLTIVDRFGIVSERAVLLDALSVVQNLAVPFTLEIEPPPADIRERAVALAREVALPEAAWTQPVAQLDGAGRLRVRLARALALDPAVVLLEHPTAAVASGDVVRLGAQIRSIARRRGAAAVALTGDRDFANAVATRVLTLEAATGRLSARGSWWSRLRGSGCFF